MNEYRIGKSTFQYTLSISIIKLNPWRIDNPKTTKQENNCQLESVLLIKSFHSSLKILIRHTTIQTEDRLERNNCSSPK